MTDKEALVSIIDAYIQMCADGMDTKNNLLPITQCIFCEHKEKPDCYAHKLADKILEAIPQFDIYKRR